MKLSIIIVSWNTRELLMDCLASIFAHPPQAPFEVWVVDNASTDDSAAYTRRRFPQVRLIENRENVGFACANNQAIQASRGRCILLLNPDTEIRADALECLVHFMDQHPEAGAAGSRLLNPDGTLQHSCSPAPSLTRELWRLFHLDALYPYGTYRMQQWDLTVARQVDVLQGASLMVRRDLLERVGLFDEAYFIYSEEVDLCRRIKQAGSQIYWVPQSEVIHYGGQSTMQVALPMFIQLYRGKVVYFRKHHGATAANVYKGILLAASLVRLLVAPLTKLQAPASRHKRLSLVRNYRHLIAVLPHI